jgi:hypothetical protein
MQNEAIESDEEQDNECDLNEASEDEPEYVIKPSRKRRPETESDSINSNDYKTCKTCEENKPKTEFHKHIGNKDNLNTKCKSCCAKDKQKRKQSNQRDGVDRTGSKICTKCKEEKEKTEFYTNPQNQGCLHSTCITCSKKDAQTLLDHLLKRKRELGPCRDCEEDNPFLLQWDHIVHSTKSICVSQCKSAARAEKEILKCVLRCVMCHRSKTLKERVPRRQLASGSHQKARRKWRVNMHKFVDDVKRKIGGCNLCGLKISDKFPPTLFDFDHIKREDKYEAIAAMIT